jgi:hypothetical protein
MQFTGVFTIGKVEVYTSKKTNETGAKINIIDMETLDSMELLTKDMKVANMCTANFKKQATVIIEVVVNNFGTRVSLVSVEIE